MAEQSEAFPTGAGRGAIDIAQKFGRFTEHWSPKIIAESNGWQFKLVKASGECVWHQHESTRCSSSSPGRSPFSYEVPTTSRPGQLFVVPRGTEHRPYAPEGCPLMLLEPDGVVNTGSAPGELTAVDDEWI